MTKVSVCKFKKKNGRPVKTQVFSILSYAFYPVVAVLLGGVVALARTLGESMRSAIQHFTAGVIFAALATELLPEVMHKRIRV